MSRNTGSPALAVVKHISDLILRSAPLARVSKDGRESLRCVHPSRRLLRKLLRMRSVSFTGSFAGDDDWECGVLAFIRHTFAASPRNAPEPMINLSPKEGVGNAGCPWHPQPRVRFALVESTRVTTSTPESPDVPARNGFTAYFVLSPAIGLFCHRRLAD